MSRRDRLLIDLSAAFNQGAGIGRYARNLVGSVAPTLVDRFELTGWYAADPSSANRFHDLATAALGELARAARRSPLSRRRIDQAWFRLPLGASTSLLLPRADLVYSPDFTAPPLRGAASVVTIHDLAFIRSPDHCPEPLRRYLTAVIPRQVRRATHVVVVSETTRRDVLEAYPIDEGRVSVIPNAADDRFFASVPLDARVRRTLDLPERYLLTVGTIEPRKNHLTIFKAIERIHGETGVPLVVVGRDGWNNQEIRRAMAALVARGSVLDLTNAEDDLLPGLYAGAAAVLQLSWYEGFGIPVVEALASGSPVITSDILAHREVAGDSAAFVDPGSVDELVEATLSILRGTLVLDRDRGRRAAHAFSWQRSGTMLAELLSEVSDGREPGRRVSADPV